MSERIIHPESHKSHESHDTSEHHARLQKHHENAAEKARQEVSEQNLAKLREHAKAHAETAAHKTVEKPADREPDVPIGTQSSLKAHAYEQSLGRVQKQLGKTDRTLSKIVHNKTVEAVSNVGAQTIARPSGILGGSICAFLGSVGLLYAAKHYGFRYNYLMLVLLFVAGFLVGSALELIIWAAHTRRNHY